MSTNFRQIYGAFILAIRREGDIFRKKIAHMKLRAFDTLLVYGPSKKIASLSDGGNFIVLGKVQARLIKEKCWWVSIYVVLISIIFAAIIHFLSFFFQSRRQTLSRSSFSMRSQHTRLLSN